MSKQLVKQLFLIMSLMLMVSLLAACGGSESSAP
jgi:hypothetical protein